LLAFCLFFLSACALPALLRPLPPEGGRDALIQPDLAFAMPDGTVLPARMWLPPATTPLAGVILALHGYTDSRDAWELSAPAFAAAGYAVYAPDQRGFGATATRGIWPGIAPLVNDAAALVAQLRARHPGQLVIVMGESMGGAVAALLAARPGAVADATVLLAPAVWGWDQLNPELAATLRITVALAPRWAPDPARAGGNILASDNIPALIRFGRDPLTLRIPTISMTEGLVDLMTAAQAAMPGLHGRVLIEAGRRDQIVPPSATAVAWEKLPPGVRRAFYPHGYHLLLRDMDRALVLADILCWLRDPDAWLPSGADAAAAAWQAAAPWEAGLSPLSPAAQWDGAWQDPVWPY
jgi:alpha-beta hydrolase superfamily lysophospholipase